MKSNEVNTGMPMHEIFDNKFVRALWIGDSSCLYIKNGNLYMKSIDGDGETYRIDFDIFKKESKGAFKTFFNDILAGYLSQDDFKEWQALQMVSWLNPILERCDKENYLKYKKDFYQRFSPDGSNYDKEVAEKFRDNLYKELGEVSNKARKDRISYIIPCKVFDIDQLIFLGYYTDIPNEQELNLYRDENGDFSENAKQVLADLSAMKIKELAESKKNPTATKIRKYLEFMPADLIISMAESGSIPYSYLEHSNLTKLDLFALRYEGLVSVLSNIQKFPPKMRITSNDILDQYGRFVDGSRIYRLAMYGFIDSKDVIRIADKNRVLRLSNYPEEDLFGEDEILGFYSEDRLTSMFLTGNIDGEFVEKYKGLLNNDEAFNRKSELIIEQIKFKIMMDTEIQGDEKEEKVQSSILQAYRVGLCTPDVLKQNIDTRYLEEQYLSGNISETDILNLYKSGVIDKDLIKQYFSEENMFKLYLAGSLDREIIGTFENLDERDERILDAIMDEKMPVSDVALLYFDGTLSVENLEDALEFAPEDFSLSTVIDSNTDFSKIKEMFERKIIDYSLVTDLKDSKIITEEQFEELKQTMNKEQFFDDLKGRTFKLITDRKSKEKVQRIHGNSGDGDSPKPKKDVYKKEKELVSKILGLDSLDDDLEEYATIESYNQNGRATSLNGYRVFGSRDNGLVIFEKFQKENAVFIMPFYQAAYFLNTRGQENSSEVVVEDKMKDKAFLRTLNQVEVIMHTEYFARNLSLAACRLSPEFDEKFKADEKYKKEVQELCESMRIDYRAEKGLDD